MTEQENHAVPKVGKIVQIVIGSILSDSIRRDFWKKNPAQNMPLIQRAERWYKYLNCQQISYQQ
jgi:hypothetical protein